MDVIFHGSCLDGCFAGLVMHVFLNLVANYSKRDIKDILEEFCKSAKNNLKDNPCPIEIWKDFMEIPQILPQEFFIYHKNVDYLSIRPGDFKEGVVDYICKKKNSFIFLVDCYGQTAECLNKLANNYKHVIVIDHHTTAKEDLEIAASKNKNIYYWFGEQKCAFEYVLEFFTTNFQFDKICPKKLYAFMQQASKYVRGNDLKINQTFNSKYFTLYIYSLGLDMNHSNPLLFKKLGNINIQIALESGKNRLPYYINQLKNEVKFPKLIRFDAMKIEFLGIAAKNFYYVSDIGIILTRHGLKKGTPNITMIYRLDNQANCYRVSLRSLRDAPQPLALKIAQYFGGGGHLCAAGCKISRQRFNGSFKISDFGAWDFNDATMLYQKD